MSLDGGNSKKDEPHLAQKLPDMDMKLSKDRKNRKEKVKPLAKVRCRLDCEIHRFIRKDGKMKKQKQK